jgi:3-methyladenine DNA glycosylase AlkD
MNEFSGMKKKGPSTEKMYISKLDNTSSPKASRYRDGQNARRADRCNRIVVFCKENLSKLTKTISESQEQEQKIVDKNIIG